MLHRRKFIAGLMACPICAAAAQAAGGAHWEYEGPHGPSSWGEVDPAYGSCSIGCAQSPIDLSGAIPAKIAHLSLAWKPQALTIQNNGHTIQADALPGSFATIGKERYELTQFHFHTPSEHALDGVRAEMEVHFVHASADRKSFAVVGAFFNPGATNVAFAQIMKVAPTHEGSVQLGEPLDPALLVPKEGALYRYEGSLTTPPCAETVLWNVYTAAVPVAATDIAAFKKIFPNNARPLQPRNRRYLLQEEG